MGGQTETLRSLQPFDLRQRKDWTDILECSPGFKIYPFGGTVMGALSVNKNDIDVRFASLTPREREVLECLLSGLPNKLIGDKLGISPRTVEVHRARLMLKMQAKNLAHLIQLAFQAGILPETGET